jgi:hypothetical protein
MHKQPHIVNMSILISQMGKMIHIKDKKFAQHQSTHKQESPSLDEVF